MKKGDRADPEKCKAPEAAIHFLPGATQANFIVHAAALSPIQSVICPDSGHVYAHEAGSIENTGTQAGASSINRRKDQRRADPGGGSFLL
ncbi:MAG: hypothetical protein V8R61_10245 [Enterocloster sp.]